MLLEGNKQKGITKNIPEGVKYLRNDYIFQLLWTTGKIDIRLAVNAEL